ncbi:MAG: GxxExxY protein [Cyclobacteriaceae bacterium]|nr:GxxExxY protein [Cyclobacteriaceae bacterium]
MIETEDINELTHKIIGCAMQVKAVEKLEDVHKAQAINYCEAYNIADGLLINFGGKSLEFKRVYNKNLVHPKISKSCSDSY